jgi:hypothetical protein
MLSLLREISKTKNIRVGFISFSFSPFSLELAGAEAGAINDTPDLLPEKHSPSFLLPEWVFVEIEGGKGIPPGDLAASASVSSRCRRAANCSSRISPV